MKSALTVTFSHKILTLVISVFRQILQSLTQPMSHLWGWGIPSRKLRHCHNERFSSVTNKGTDQSGRIFPVSVTATRSSSMGNYSVYANRASTEEILIGIARNLKKSFRKREKCFSKKVMPCKTRNSLSQLYTHKKYAVLNYNASLSLYRSRQLSSRYVAFGIG